MAKYGHIYPYMQYLGAQEVREIPLQRINNQEAGLHYTKLTQLWCNATQLLCKEL